MSKGDTDAMSMNVARDGRRIPELNQLGAGGVQQLRTEVNVAYNCDAINRRRPSG